MKNLKKFVALLLAGVMAMVMLTACSGGSNAETKAKENKMIDSLKTQGVMTASENDNTLRKKTMDILNQDIADAKFSILGAIFMANVHVDGQEDQYLTVTATTKYEYGKVMLSLLDFIAKEVGQKVPGADVNVKANGAWSHVCVVVQADGNKTYLAIAFQIENPAHKGK